MLLCIRNLVNNGGRYVVPSTISVTGQHQHLRHHHRQTQHGACRLIGTTSRQSQVGQTRQSVEASTSLAHKFLGSSVSAESTATHQTASKDIKQSEKSHSYSGSSLQDSLYTSGKTNCLLYGYSLGVRDCKNDIHSLAKSDESQRQPFPDSFNQKTSRLLYSNGTVGWTSLEESAKDQTKVQFSALPKTASAPYPKSARVPVEEIPSQKKPSNDNLLHVYETLKVDFPAFFVKRMDYRIYHRDVEFVNNIRGTHTKGLQAYYKQMLILKIVGHIKYAYVKMDVLKITMHPQDNTVKVRWRINGITGTKVLFTFWKFKIWKIKEALKETVVWHDGFSTFYIGDDGLIQKHVAEKMMPDDNVETEKPSGGIQTKLASELTFSRLN